MPLVVALALLGPVVAPPAARCADPLAARAAARAPATPHRLGEEPPATAVLTVFRKVDGCVTPMVLRTRAPRPALTRSLDAARRGSLSAGAFLIPGAVMDANERLIATMEIRALMARRVRCLDTKDWDGFADCYAPDVDASWAESGNSVSGNKALAARNAALLRDIVTVHQIHEPEIMIESADRASGVWPLNDLLSWEKDGRRHWYRGYGHYHQSYVRLDGRWLIREHRLTRLLTERGSEEIGVDYGPIGPREDGPRG